MSEQISSLLYQLGVASLVPIGAILTALGKLMVQKIQLQSLKIRGENWEETRLILRTAVMSAEKQLQLAAGSDKKKKATEIAKKLFKQRKIEMADDVLSELIEAQVWDTLDAPTLKPTAVPEMVSPVEKKEESPLETVG